jgi:S-DNA-T family DNA segregation ATPase FtsK/SpoIIIE
MKRDVAIKSLNILFKQLKIKAEIKQCKLESTFLTFDIVLNPGGTFKQIERFATEIALSLKALSEPLIYPITKEGIIRMEIMVSEPEVISFSDVIDSREFLNSKATLPLALGKCRNGSPLIVDLAKMPHLLIGGATGSGKSIMLQVIINSLLLNKNRYISFALIDPKRVEFSYYDALSQLYGPVARNVNSSIELLRNLVEEMEIRFSKLEKHGCRDITTYKGKMPFIVVVIDELADLMMVSKKGTQDLICRLAQKSRACGIHLVVATQRPSVDVVTGLIKANFPARLSCQVSAAVDSRILLDRGGAERLVGKGDAIINCHEYNFKRFKGSFVSEKEILDNIKIRKSWWSRIWSS